MKRPAFQFYPGDWLRATELRSCSVGARGLWIDMICLMHEGSPYGHLKVADKVIHPANLSRMVGASIEDVTTWLAELEEAGVFSRTDDGCIFSRRMVRDEDLRQRRAAGGILGGNPTLKKDPTKVNLPPNLKPTPASASASASAEPTDADASVGGGPPPCPQQAIVDLYHELLPAHPRVLDLTRKRQAMVQQRWRQVWEGRKRGGRPHARTDLVERFRHFFGEEVRGSKFLTGRASAQRDRAPFVADFEWLMNASNFLKVLEGKYRDEAEK